MILLDLISYDMLFICGLLLFINGWLWNKLTNRPPQPFALPIIGNFYLCKPDKSTGIPPMHKIFYDLSIKYGKIFGFQFGNKYTIVISSPDIIRETLKDNEDATSSRFVPESMKLVTQGVGIALQPNIERWKKCRGALVSAVTSKRIDLNKEDTILSEIHDMVYYLKSNQNNAIDFTKHTRRESINILMRLVCSFRYGSEMSSEFLEIEEIIGNIFKAISAGNPTDYIPIAKLFGGGNKFINNLQDDINKRDYHIDKWIEWHKKTLPAKGFERDFIDLMLNDDSSEKLNFKEIRSIIWDTMAGGIDTSALSFEWLIYILTNYPNIQTKIHDELDRVVGPDRLPTLEDIQNLKYLNATICELFRMKHFAPFGIPHHTTHDLILGGYNIPKNTQVIYNLHKLHMDPDLWKNPHEFNPDRFMPGGSEEDLIENYLDTDRIRTKYSKTGDDNLFKFLPFGFGKRQCAGFGLGRIIMFLKTATHLHCFKWYSENGKSADLSESFGVTLTPKNPISIKVTARPSANLVTTCDWNTSDIDMPGVLLKNITQ